MSLSSYNPHDRYRRRAAKRFSNFMTGLFILGLFFAAGFWVNNMRVGQSKYILEEDKRVLSEELETLQKDRTNLRAEAQTANLRLEQLRANYDEILSDGALKNLLTLIKQQIENGVAEERLNSVILSARPPQNCTTPESKRFIVKTPVYNGPVSVSSIAGNAIKIYGDGISAQNAQGHKEAWFDPAKPVNIKIKIRGGTEKVKTGVLPLYHSVVVGNKEYRITIANAAKSFAKVTFDHCDYP